MACETIRETRNIVGGGRVLSCGYTSKITDNETLDRNTWHGQEKVSDFRPVRPQNIHGIKQFVSEGTRECFYRSKSFQHFHYALNLVRDCASRVELVLPSLIKETQLPNDVMVKIRFTGQVSEDNLKLVTKRKGKKKMTENQTIWETSPLIYFQNEHSLETAISNLLVHDGNHKILVTSNTTCTEDMAIDNIVIVDADHVQEAIALCLEEPLHHILNKWSRGLEPPFQGEEIFHITSEIVNIRKQMMFDETKDIPTLVMASTKIPTNLKDFLFSHDDVTSFGLWENSHFKVFVKNETNRDKLFKEMTSMNKDFFSKYVLEIEYGRIVGKLTMKQGDFLVKNPPDIEESVNAGTLGGFVTKPNDLERIYALTSGHLFPEERQFAYADASLQYQQIGKCVFTTTDSQCDTAIIEIDESVAKDCDIIFRRDDGKKTNAHVYDGGLDQLGILHKKGAGSGVTKGTMLSEEFYLKNLIDDDNRESVFFVRGTGGCFSDQGDSGSLVFSRPRHVKQDYVNVVGMIFGSNVIVDDDYVEKSQYKPHCSFENDDGQIPEDNTNDARHISGCFRIRPALERFKRTKRVPVKFKDDLSASSSSSSSDDGL